MSQRKIALGTAGLLVIWSLFWIVANGIHALTAPVDFGYVAQLLGRFLILLPLPAMLAVYYSSRANIELPKGLRRLAVATAVIFGMLYAALPVGVMLAGRAFGFQTPSGWILAWRALFWASQLGLAIFLVALAWPAPETAPSGGAAGASLLRHAAMLAIVAGVIALILNIVNSAEAVTRLLRNVRQNPESWNGPALTRLNIVLGGVWEAMPEICRLIVPLIVYKGLTPQRTASNSTFQSPQQA